MKIISFSIKSYIAIFLLFHLFLTTLVSADEDGVRKGFDNLFGESKKHVAFFWQIKKVFSEGNPESIASLVSYPLTIRGAGTTIDKIESRKEFVEKFDMIITDRIKEVVERQELSDLGASSGGVRFGLGDLWYSGICQAGKCENMVMKIVQINHTDLE